MVEGIQQDSLVYRLVESLALAGIDWRQQRESQKNLHLDV